MERLFSYRDAKALLREHKELIAELEGASCTEEKYWNSISSAADTFLQQEVVTILKEIPIDEINHDKRGFRIKALRDSGYNTIADISSASVSRIASVHGISKDTAYSIKDVVDGIVSTVSESTKVRLSTDRKTDGSTQLVLIIHKYRCCQPYKEICNHISNSYNKRIKDAMTELLPATGRIKWFFTSKADRQLAIEAYDYLNDLLRGEYTHEINNILTSLKKISKSSESEAWQDFAENSIQFINILEEACPGILGTDDTVYGLPEKLALEIQDECFFPDGLLCKLRRYQELGVKYILHQERVLLGDEMGLGKTIQAIAVMVSLKNTNATHFVVVCPASVIINWCREIRKMSTLNAIKIHGTGRASALRSWIQNGGVAVTTYETVAHFKLDESFMYSLLVVDEAHYIKNPSAKRTTNVQILSNHAERLLFMTGTALENRVNEMIFLIKMLRPAIAFQISTMSFLSTAPQFREKIAPVYYRRKREDVLTELPELMESKEWCTLLPEEEKIYEKAILARHYSNARRVSWNIDDLHYSSKAKRLLEIIEEAKNEGRKILIFSFFLDTIQKLANLLDSQCLQPINGSVSPKRRQEIIDQFDQAAAGSVLIAQIQSGGTGLNIQSASVVVLCEPQFKPSIENQAISRAYRMGQARNVLVYRLLCVDTVDEKITALLESKQAIFNAFANESVAANNSLELDDNGFSNIIKDEIDRINAKYGYISSQN